MEDQLLRAKNTGNDLLTNPNAYRFRRSFGRTYYQFKVSRSRCAVAVSMNVVMTLCYFEISAGLCSLGRYYHRPQVLYRCVFPYVSLCHFSLEYPCSSLASCGDFVGLIEILPFKWRRACWYYLLRIRYRLVSLSF